MRDKYKDKKFNDYLIDKLKDAKEAKAFFNTVIQEYEEDKDIQALMLALQYLAKAQGGVKKLRKILWTE